jgi:hypothetical protein
MTTEGEKLNVENQVEESQLRKTNMRVYYCVNPETRKPTKSKDIYASTALY